MRTKENIAESFRHTEHSERLGFTGENVTFQPESFPLKEVANETQGEHKKTE